MAIGEERVCEAELAGERRQDPHRERVVRRLEIGEHPAKVGDLVVGDLEEPGLGRRRPECIVDVGLRGRRIGQVDDPDLPLDGDPLVPAPLVSSG